MKLSDLQKDIAQEVDNLNHTVEDCKGLLIIAADRDLTVYEKAAAALMLSQWYNGVENILKRLSKFHNVRLPSGEDSHLQIFLRFCEPPMSPLPILFSDSLREKFTILRRFRHFTYHGYAFKIEWDRLILMVEMLPVLWQDFQLRLQSHLQTLEV